MRLVFGRKSMKKIFLFFNLILISSSICHGDEAFRVEYSKTCFFGFCSENSSVEDNSGNISADGKIKSKESGETKVNFTVISSPQRTRENIIGKLNAPRMISLRQLTNDNKNDLIYGGLTEIVGGVYVVARHVWMGSSPEEIKNSLPEIESLKIFEVLRNDGLPLDILLVTDRELDENIKSRLGSMIGAPTRLMAWVSWQFGNDGSQSSDKISWGTIQEFFYLNKIPQSQHDFSLSTNQENLTSPASSGSIVWNYNERSEIHPLGIITCIKNISDNRSLQTKFPYVVSFQRIFNPSSYVKELSFADSLRTVRIEEEPHCKPIDGRGAGGD